MTDEIKETEEVKEETKEEPQVEFKDFVERGEKVVEELRSLTKRNEDLAARKLLGGNSEAGQHVEEKKEETPQEYKDRIMRGG